MLIDYLAASLDALEDFNEDSLNRTQDAWQKWQKLSHERDIIKAALALKKAGLSIGSRIVLGGLTLEVAPELDLMGQPQGYRCLSDGTRTDILWTIQLHQLTPKEDA